MTTRGWAHESKANGLGTPALFITPRRAGGLERQQSLDDPTAGRYSDVIGTATTKEPT